MQIADQAELEACEASGKATVAAVNEDTATAQAVADKEEAEAEEAAAALAQAEQELEEAKAKLKLLQAEAVAKAQAKPATLTFPQESSRRELSWKFQFRRDSLPRTTES